MSPQIPAYNSSEKKGYYDFFTVMGLLGAILCISLLVVRIASSISLNEPLQLHVTGDEFSNNFVIWRATQGLPVYADPMSPPYYHPAYNWLFYYFYGYFSKLALGLFSLSDAWIPTIGRYISLLAMMFCIVASYFAFAKTSQAQDNFLKLICLSFAVYVAAGPLIGFWNITARADQWAMTLEIVGCAFFLFFNSERRWTALFLLMIFCYFAWAFKQGNVFAIGGVGLFLLVRQDWKRLAVLVIFIPGTWALTFLTASPLYMENILFVDFPLVFSLQRMVRNLANFISKSGPSLILFFVIWLLVFTKHISLKSLWRHDGFVFAVGGIICSAFLSIPASAQTGGAENYFFMLSYFISLMVLASVPEIKALDKKILKRVFVVGSFGWSTLIVAITMVLFGVVGVINVRDQHDNYSAGKRCIDSLARPLFVNNPYLLLPWMAPGNESYTISYTYYLERQLGRPFKHGGFGGLISSGKFASLALQASDAAVPQNFDGASLSGYKLLPSNTDATTNCSMFHIFTRKLAPK
jgi:hypothetical protein